MKILNSIVSLAFLALIVSLAYAPPFSLFLVLSILVVAFRIRAIRN